LIATTSIVIRSDGGASSASAYAGVAKVAAARLATATATVLRKARVSLLLIHDPLLTAGTVTLQFSGAASRDSPAVAYPHNT
jgi:hypothetical protein